MINNKLTSNKKNKIRYLELNKDNYDLIKESLLQNIISVGMDAFGDGMNKEEIIEHLYPTDKLYLAYGQNNLLGFATANLNNKAVDLVGAAVRKNSQGQGIYSELAMRRINSGLNANKNQVTFRTQNPKIELGIKRYLDDLVNFDIIAGYNCERELKKNYYGRILTSERPFSGVIEMDLQYKDLNYCNGDTFAFRFDLRMS